MAAVLSKTYIYPLLLPQRFFIDNFNKANAYIDMNPSMHIDSDGNVKILVRSINYRKYFNKQFTIYENQSASTYRLLSGKIANDSLLDIESFTVEDVISNYNIPTYPTYWKGMEDIRFINSNEILVTVPECNPNGNPSIFHANIENNIIDKFKPCLPNKTEKNWMPFSKDYVIYSLSPFLMKEIDNDNFAEVKLTEDLRSILTDYHGSTNGIHFQDNKYIFLIHINKERTYHRWLLFDIKNKEIELSKEFVFFRNSYIEFPVSLCNYKNRVFISIGVNDEKAFIIETRMETITKN